jgi:hypothetical protein
MSLTTDDLGQDLHRAYLEVLGVIGIPLRNRLGDIVAVTVVDRSDFETLSKLKWHLSSDGTKAGKGRYAKSKSNGLLHRMVLDLGVDDPREGDHLNGDTLDNRRINLRVATRLQNAQNVGQRGTNPYGHGVRKSPGGRFIAYGNLDYKQTYLGTYDTHDEAAEVARKWRADHHDAPVDRTSVPDVAVLYWVDLLPWDDLPEIYKAAWRSAAAQIDEVVRKDERDTYRREITECMDDLARNPRFEG